MAKKLKKPGPIPPVEKPPEKAVPVDPEQPLENEEDPDQIPDEEEEETPPYEPPEPGEGP